MIDTEVVGLTQQLVQIPSLNPMNRDVTGDEYLERRVTDFLQGWAIQRGLSWERYSVLPDRENLLMMLPGQGAPRDRVLLLEVHQDTVPVDGMTIDPFAAELRDGRIYGRGACDVKGGMAVFLRTLELLAASAADRPTIVLACTINEENGFDGVRHLRQLWTDGGSRLLPRAPDWAIVAEPTELDVVVAHKGTVRWRCHALGRAAHSSNPAAGENAIYRMAEILGALRRYAHESLAHAPEHPLVGRATLSVGTIRGGISVNTVPDRCTIEIDRRLLPDESPADAAHDIHRYVAQQIGSTHIQHDAPFLASPGLPANRNQQLGVVLQAVAQQHAPSSHCKGVPFGTDAGTIAGAGVPVVVFGPGSIQQAHTCDEWIDIHDLSAALRILVAFCQSIATRLAGNEMNRDR